MEEGEPIQNPLLPLEARDLPFSISGGHIRTREDTLREVALLQAALLKRGLEAGDTIAIYAPNSPQQIALIFACFELSIRIALLNSRLSDSILALQISATGAAALIADAHCDFTSVQQYTLDELEQEQRDVAFQPQKWNLDAEAVIVFTSGSEGEPKGVIHSLRSLLCAASASNSISGFCTKDTWLLSLPLYHLGGFQIFLRTAVGGGCLAMTPSQDTQSLLLALKDSLVTFLSLVPTQLQELLQKTDLSQFKSRGGKILLAGAPSSKELLAQLRDLGMCVIPCYGMTESAAHCTALYPPYALEYAHTVGRALPGTEVFVLDSTGTPVPHGQVGRIVIDSPQLAAAYLALDGSQIPISNPFESADLGFFDDSGNLNITGRADRILISGGENISAQEIENKIYESGCVSLAAIVAVPDRRWGERPLLFVVLNSGIPQARLETYIHCSLAKLHTPVDVIYKEQLPLTAIGKIDYPALLKEALLIATEKDTVSGDLKST